MKRWLAPLIVIIVLALSACANPFVIACRDVAQDVKGNFKYTARQAAVACDRAQFYADPHLFTKNDENKSIVINPNGLLAADLEKVLKDEVKSLNSLLSYQNQENSDFIDWAKGFRQGLEKEEQIVLEILRRLNYVKSYNDFTDAVGELPESMQSKEFTYFFPNGRKYYSMRLLYSRTDKRLEDIPFTSEYLEAAKRDGTLKLIDSFEVMSLREFAKKVPNLHDANDFSWDKQNQSWVILSYKVMSVKDKPVDNVVQYIEIYRKAITKNFSGAESVPAVRGYMAAGGSKVTVFVMDYDREGNPGFGSPDEVVKIFSDITTGSDLYSDPMLKDKLITSIFESPQNNIKDKLDRKKPKDHQVYTSIVKMGDAPLDVWEQGIFSVPFDYKILSQNLELVYAPPITSEEKRLAEREKLKQIKLFIREFKQDSKVVVREHWLPKKAYSERNIAHSAALTDTIKIRKKNGIEESGEIAYFAEHVKVIDYSFGGKCSRIVDDDGSGIFKKKRAIACPAGMAGATSASPNIDIFPN